MTSDESKDARALTSFADVIRDGAEERSPDELEVGLANLSARIAFGASPRRRIVRWSLIGATAGLCALLAVHFALDARAPSSVSPSPVPLYAVEGGSVLDGGYLRESGHDGVKLVFSEGSRFELLPGTRGRLRAVDTQGARVAIEQGTASFHVIPGSDRRWLVEVGPFVVTVKGTVFTVSWDSSSERFELKLQRGRVVVSGPVSGGDIALRSGQRLVVNLPRAETVITEDGPDGPEREPATSPSAPVAEPLPSAIAKDKPSGASVAHVLAPPPKNQRRWTEALADGNWDGILEDAERSGTASALEQASSEDLFALASAARYRHRLDLARAALLAERRRFPASTRALDSIFFLGRVEELREDGSRQAIAWYDEYLARVPSGQYAAEALGRKMTLVSESRGPDEARPIADEYLRRFPKGSYAGPARALRRAP
jgi:TolA-binding protein